MNIRIRNKAEETKGRNTRYQSEKTSCTKSPWYTHEYSWRIYRNRPSIVSFKAVRRELQKIKNSNAPSSCFPLIQHVRPKVSIYISSWLPYKNNRRLFNLLLELKMKKIEKFQSLHICICCIKLNLLNKSKLFPNKIYSIL